ncbi:MAG: hypothetical protein AAF750_02075 [Planctomycetota bacterium]
MSDTKGHFESNDPLTEALDQALGTDDSGLSASASQRLMELTDPGMTARLDAALSAEGLPAGLEDRLVGLLDGTSEEPAAADAVGVVGVVGRIAPAGGSWWRAAAMIGVVGGLVGLLVFGWSTRDEGTGPEVVVKTPPGANPIDGVEGLAVEPEVELALSEELEALNGWLSSEASSSEGALDRQLSVFAVRLASVDPVASSAPLSPDEVAEAAAGDVELQDDLDLLEAYNEEWVF